MIRLYEKTDKTALMALFMGNVPKYFTPEEPQLFDNYLERNTDDYFVVLDKEERIVGGGGIGFRDEMAVLTWGFVDASLHGKGFGTELTLFRLQYVRDFFPEIKKIEVHTAQFTFGFYQKMGFVLDEIKKDHWAVGYDLYRMSMNC